MYSVRLAPACDLLAPRSVCPRRSLCATRLRQRTPIRAHLCDKAPSRRSQDSDAVFRAHRRLASLAGHTRQIRYRSNRCPARCRCPTTVTYHTSSLRQFEMMGSNPRIIADISLMPLLYPPGLGPFSRLNFELTVERRLGGLRDTLQRTTRNVGRERQRGNANYSLRSRSRRTSRGMTLALHALARRK